MVFAGCWVQLRGGEARRSLPPGVKTEAKQLLRLNGQYRVVMLAGTGDPFTPSSWSQLTIEDQLFFHLRIAAASATINTRTMGCFFRRMACPTGPSGCYVLYLTEILSMYKGALEVSGISIYWFSISPHHRLALVASTHSLTNSASIQSTDIDSGLNTRLLKYSSSRFTLFSYPSTSPIHSHSLSPLDLTLYIPSAQGPQIICSSPLPCSAGFFCLPVRLRQRRGGSQPSER
ncbi:hypothetical protein An16g08190 [Aspergillus niger]|uniref:Uncharacterized protein n=2 Tax=Aspergillus niger TaxID=5061 RepID=A2R8S5_ASPNC|nr:hypothetical protein An16g08190 [Aspergillus niger]CAK47068.1 hypothetical protein An16g08190 [Aspergillus niger]